MSTQPIKISYLERVSGERDPKHVVAFGEPDLTPPVTEADLRASLAAIHCQALRPDWRSKTAMLLQMAVIVDECERCIPALKGLRP